MIKFKSLYFFSVVLIIISCNTGNKSNDSLAIALLDTIQTKSGLEYYYIKKGEGRKVETGSEVSTYLSLMVEDSVVWTSYDERDSLFTFIANRDKMIKGFTEMIMLLREGDEVVAILPDSIGYGEKGSGNIPPHAILIYNKFKMVKVSKPKKLLSDTLLPVIEKEGIAKMIEKYQQIISSPDSAEYHRSINQIYSIWDELNRKNMHQQALDLIDFYNKKESDWYLRSLSATSLEKMGLLQRSMDSLNILIQEYPTVQGLKNDRKLLAEKILKSIK
jgi:hypothetical protein